MMEHSHLPGGDDLRSNSNIYHFARFGLEMHLRYKRDGSQPSKTKCVFFPPPQYFDQMEWRLYCYAGEWN
jgi:hypothetical protein